MDKKGFLKVILICVIAIAVVFVAGIVMAQTISQVKLTNDLSVPLGTAGNIISANNIAPTGALPEVATVLVDNFEYWNNPLNMGWNLVKPPYPVWGSSYGLGHVNNVFDCELESRVLDTYNPFNFWCFYGVPQISKKCAIATNDENNPTRSIPGECDEKY